MGTIVVLRDTEIKGEGESERGRSVAVSREVAVVLDAVHVFGNPW